MLFRYETTPKILSLCTEIVRLVGRTEGIAAPKPQPQLRKKNRIRSIQGSLSIEGNTLSLDQITALINNQRVLAPKKDIIEVQNAIKAYDNLGQYKPFSVPSIKNAHATLMENLIQDAGKFRSSPVSILKMGRVTHVAPPASRVPALISDLLLFLKNAKDIHELIKSSLFHYELEFIHPFSDGNGRVGRLWQTMMLSKYSSIFEYVPIESMIKKKQRLYYKALEDSDHKGSSQPFLEFSLQSILESLEEFLDEYRPEQQTQESRLELAREHFSNETFGRKEYMGLHKNLSSATASRDLNAGVQNRLLVKSGDKAVTRYKFTK